MQLQPGVKLVRNKLLYLVSPLRKIYPNGLSVEGLRRHNPTKREKLLTIYRNLIRLTRYLQIHTFHKKSLHDIYRIKLRQDYGYRYKVLLDKNFELSDDDLDRKLVNTVHFAHNACLDSISNTTQRPVSLEYNILTAIIKYEISKNLFPLLNKKLESKFIKLENFVELRQSERAWFMESLDYDLKREMLWWLDLDKGILKNEVCFDYLKEIKERKNELMFLDKMVYSNFDFEKSLVLLNQDCDILL